MRIFVAMVVTFLVGGVCTAIDMKNGAAGAVVAITIMGGFILAAIEHNKQQEDYSEEE